jgi:hypothetical protein
MTDDAGSTPAAPLTTKIGIEINGTIIVTVDQVIVVGELRAINETTVAQLMESIKPPGRLYLAQRNHGVLVVLVGKTQRSSLTE